jgi:hypothetical protein
MLFQAVDYGVHKLWESNNVGVCFSFLLPLLPTFSIRSAQHLTSRISDIELVLILTVLVTPNNIYKPQSLEERDKNCGQKMDALAFLCVFMWV